MTFLLCEKFAKLDLQKSDEERMNFLKNIKWEDVLLSPAQKLQVEEIRLKNNSRFARHRCDIGMNTDFKVKLTPQHGEPV